MAAERNQGEGIRLLSLDGSGPGAISQLKIIGEFMSRLAFELGVDVNTLFPADLFDLIGGVGFGGLVAVLLGQLGMNVNEATEELIAIASSVFTDEAAKRKSPQLNTKNLKNALKSMLERKNLPVNLRLKDHGLPGSYCKVFLLVAPCIQGAPCQRFRNYDSRTGGTLDYTLMEAVLATMAIPQVFESVLIGPDGRKQKFMSASFGSNNPIWEVLNEAEKTFTNHTPVSTILSLGSGRPTLLPWDTSLTNSSNLDDLMTRLVLDCEKVAREISAQLPDQAVYVRLNVDRGMENVKFIGWQDTGVISSLTDIYLNDAVVVDNIDRALLSMKERQGSVTLAKLNQSRGIKVVAKTVPAVSPYFLPREDHRVALHEHLVKASPTTRRILVLSGMAGCGKTQIVSHFVQEHHSHFNYIFFVDATSVASIRCDFEAAIRSLGGEHQDQTFDEGMVFLKEKGDHNGNWLLILDQADDPDVDLASHLPASYHGAIIITTRNPQFGYLSNTAHLEIKEMSEEQAYEILKRAAHRVLTLPPDEDIAAKRLTKELGNLAVALVQAGSYCASVSKSYTFTEYLALFQEHRDELMKEAMPVMLDRYRGGVYATLDLSYDKLPPLSQQFLHLAGYLHQSDLSLVMLARAASHQFSDPKQYLPRSDVHRNAQQRLVDMLCPNGRWHQLHAEKIIRSLRSFSLISSTTSSNSLLLRFHPLVHCWCRDKLAPGNAELYKQMAIRTITSCTAQSDVPLYRFLLPHLTELISRNGIKDLHVNDQLAFGTVLKDTGFVAKARPLFEAALANLEQALSANRRPDLAAAAAMVAAVYFWQERWVDAEGVLSFLLDTRRKTLGKSHAQTIKTAKNLARVYRKQGKQKEYDDLMKEVSDLEQSGALGGDQNEGDDVVTTVSASVDPTNNVHSPDEQAIATTQTVIPLTASAISLLIWDTVTSCRIL